MAERGRKVAVTKKQPNKDKRCIQCSYKTDRSANLDRHIRTKHLAKAKKARKTTSSNRAASAQMDSGHQILQRLGQIEEQLARLVPVTQQEPAYPPLQRQDATVQQNGNHLTLPKPAVRVDPNLDSSEDENDDVVMWSAIVRKWGRFFTNWQEDKDFSSIANRRILNLHPQTLWEAFENVHQNQHEAYKLQIQIGYVLRDIVDGELEYFFASTNTSIFEKPIPIMDDRSLARVRKSIFDADVEEKCLRKRKNSRFTFFAPVNMLFVMNTLGGPIRGGIKVPEFCRRSKFILSFTDCKPSLCFFYCVARASSKSRYLFAAAKKLFLSYCAKTDTDPALFKGIDLSHLSQCEVVFGMGMHVLGIKTHGKSRKPHFFTIRSAENHPNNKIYLLLHDQHFMFITDPERLCGMFQCESCYHVSNRLDNFRNHSSLCGGQQRVEYKTGPYCPKESIIAKLQKIGISNIVESDFYDNSVIVFDFEVELKKTPGFECNTNNLTFTERHIPLSVAIATNIQGFQNAKFMYNFRNCTKLIEDFIRYSIRASKQAQIRLRNKLSYVVDQLDTMEVEAEMSENGQLVLQIQNVAKRLDDFIMRTPIVGFNSSRYDIRAIKHVFFPTLKRLDNINLCVKKDGAYLTVASDNLKFLDIVKFLGPGEGSLAAYLKSYGRGEVGEKMMFPYGFLSEPSRLADLTDFPAYSAFDSALTGGNLFEVDKRGTDAERRLAGMSDYVTLQAKWRSGRWSNMLEYLRDYNCADVVPLVKSVMNHQQFYFNKHITMLREYITLPSLTLPYLFSFCPPEDYFVLLDEDVNKLFRANLFGGLAIIITRYAEKDVTRIKEHVFGPSGHLCKQIQCLDSNILYASWLGHDMFTGPYIVRDVHNDFRASMGNKGTFTIQYLEYLAMKTGEPIQHALSPNGEFSQFICGHLRHADGYVRQSEKRTCPLWIEVNTCSTHGCPACFPDRAKCNSLIKKTYGELFRESCEKLAAIRERYQVKVYWECELRRFHRTDAEFNYFCKHFCLGGPWISSRKMTEATILEGIVSGEIFGAVLCSVRVPEQLKERFDQFPPIVCRKVVSSEICGATMRNIAEEMGYKRLRREQLVSCFATTDVLFSTSTIEWFLDHGIHVYNVKKVVQFTRKQPFRKFTQEIARMRKHADATNDALLSTTAKGLGNSSYGFTLYSAKRSVDTKYCNRDEALNYIRSNQFIGLEELSEDIVEVSLEKRKVIEGLPLHIGFQVYSLSKVYMQHFVHDVLGKHLDPRKWEILASDTDSVCLALGADRIDQCVLPAMMKSWQTIKPKYFVDDSSPEAFAQTSRTPLLFKEEIKSAEIFIAPSAKCYYAGMKSGGSSQVVKTSAKGVNKRQNVLTEKMYMESVFGVKDDKGDRCFKFHNITNVGFRTMAGTVFTYEQVKHGFSPIYLKREVLPNLFSTRTLEEFAEP